MMARYSWNEWFWSRNQFPYQYKQNTVPALDLFFFFVAARGDRSSTRSAHLITSSSDKRRAAQVLAPCGHSGHVVISCLELKEGKEAME